MMVRFLGQDGDACHEAERLGKVVKAHATADAFGVSIIGPLRQLLHRCIASGVIQS